MARAPYKPGDLIELVSGFHGQNRTGPFSITRLMPARDNKEPEYRVRGPDGLERVVGHHEIIEKPADSQ